MILETTLLEQQALLVLLLKQAQRPASADERRITLEGLTAALAGHLTALDQAVLPALMQGEDSASLEPTRECAVAVSRTLAELLGTEQASSTFDGLLAVLAHAVFRLFELERRTILPTVHRLQSARIELQLAAALELHLERAMGNDVVRAFAATGHGGP